MILQNEPNAILNTHEFNKFIDFGMLKKPQVFQSNKDIFWSFSQEHLIEMLSNFTFVIEFEKNEKGFVGSITTIEEIVGKGTSFNRMIEDAASQLIQYASDYYNNFEKYHNDVNKKAHLPYMLNVLLQEDLDGVKRLITGWFLR